MRTGNAKKAATAYKLAGSVFKAIGAADNAFASEYMVLQIGFMAAETEEQYRFIHEQSRRQIDQSPTVSYGSRFNQIVLAADAAFWAATVASDGAKRAWIDRSLDELATVDPTQADDVSVARYASLLIADLQALLDLEPDPEKLSKAEARFSKTAGSLAGRHMAYPNDPKKGSAVGAALARIAAGQFVTKAPPLFGRKNP